jgi:hypothetical protein
MAVGRAAVRTLLGPASWSRLGHPFPGGIVARLSVSEVEQLMDAHPGESLEAVLGVFEVFASGSLADEVYVLDDVAGKRIAIAPSTVKTKYRRG